MSCVHCGGAPHDIMSVVCFFTSSKEFVDRSLTFDDVWYTNPCRMQVRADKEVDFSVELWRLIRCYLMQLCGKEMQEQPDRIVWNKGDRCLVFSHRQNQLILHFKEAGMTTTDNFGIEVKNCLIYENLISDPFTKLYDFTKRLENTCLRLSEKLNAE